MPNDVVSRAIDAVCAGDHLTADHAGAVLAEIMEGRADPVQTGAFLIALRAKGETVPELVGLARTMRSLAAPVRSGRPELVDTRAIVQLNLGNVDKALRDMERVVNEAPTPMRLFHLSRAHERARNATAALAMLRQANEQA